MSFCTFDQRHKRRTDRRDEPNQRKSKQLGNTLQNTRNSLLYDDFTLFVSPPFTLAILDFSSCFSCLLIPIQNLPFMAIQLCQSRYVPQYFSFACILMVLRVNLTLVFDKFDEFFFVDSRTKIYSFRSPLLELGRKYFPYRI